MYFYSLNQPSINIEGSNSVASFSRTRAIKISGTSSPQEVLAANPDRKALFFENQATIPARIKIADAVSETENPGVGSIADYSFSVPPEGAGCCPFGVPTEAVSVFYDSNPDNKSIVITETW